MAGATIVTGCTAIGLRTVVEPEVQVSEPVENWSSGASVREKVTVNDCSSPAAPNVSVDGETTALMPARPSIDAVNVPAWVEVTVRVIVSGAVSVPTAIEARLRLLGSTGSTPKSYPSA